MFVLPRVSQAWPEFEENSCSCYAGGAYLYYIHPELGPWYWLDADETDHKTFYPPGVDGGPRCFFFCLDSAILAADSLCSQYSFPDQHVQLLFLWHFEDANNDSFGTAEGYFNTLFEMHMCQ
jgi:hypothetical protein